MLTYSGESQAGSGSVEKRTYDGRSAQTDPVQQPNARDYKQHVHEHAHHTERVDPKVGYAIVASDDVGNGTESDP